MTDRELLELAAKAAEFKCEWNQFTEQMDCRNEEGFFYWNPLTDDGDALRLAVKLGIKLERDDSLSIWKANAHVESFFNAQCPHTATRRAIVRAAAEIGKENK